MAAITMRGQPRAKADRIAHDNSKPNDEPAKPNSSTLNTNIQMRYPIHGLAIRRSTGCLHATSFACDTTTPQRSDDTRYSLSYRSSTLFTTFRVSVYCAWTFYESPVLSFFARDWLTQPGDVCDAEHCKRQEQRDAVRLKIMYNTWPVFFDVLRGERGVGDGGEKHAGCIRKIAEEGG
jgi:hypothetical protein